MLSKYTLTAALLLAAASASLAAVAPLSSGALDANRIRGLYRRDGPALDFDAKDETAGKPLPSALLNSGSFILTPDEDTYDGLFQKGEQDDYIAPPPASSAKAPSSSSPSVDPQIQQLFADDGQNEYFGNDSSSSKDPSIPDDLFITPTASPTSEPVSEHGNASPNFEAKDAGDQNVTTDSGGFVSLIPVSHLQATASPTEDSDPVITPTPSTTPQPKEKGNDESNFNPASSNADQDEKGDNITDPHANILIQKPDSPSSTEDSSSIAGPTLTTDDSDNNSSSQNNSSSNLSNLIQRPIQPLVRPPPILPLDQDKETDSTPSSSIVENEKPSRTALLPDLESNPPRVPLLPNLGSKPSSDEEESSTPSNTEKDGKSSRTPLTDNLVVNPLFDEQTNGDQPTSPPLLPNLVPKLSSDDEESSTPSSTENDEKPSRTPLVNNLVTKPSLDEQDNEDQSVLSPLLPNLGGSKPSSDDEESSTPSSTENDEKPSRTPLVNKLVTKPSLDEQDNGDQSVLSPLLPNLGGSKPSSDEKESSTPSSTENDEKPSRTPLVNKLVTKPSLDEQDNEDQSVLSPLLPNLGGSKPSSDEKESSTPSNTENDEKPSRTPLVNNLVTKPSLDEQDNEDQSVLSPLLPNLGGSKPSSDEKESSTPSSTENDEKPSRTPLVNKLVTKPSLDEQDNEDQSVLSPLLPNLGGSKPSSDEKESSTPSNTENDEKPSRTPLVNKLVAKPSLNEQNNEDQPSQNDESDPSLPSTPSRTTPNYLKPSSVQGGNNAVVADTNPISDLNEEGKSGKVEKDDLSPSSPNSSASSQEPAATSFTGSDLPKLSL